MQKRDEMDWVGCVLQDVVAFLAQNDMMDSAKMLAVAAAHIEHEMKAPKSVPQAIITSAANVVLFPTRTKLPI